MTFHRFFSCARPHIAVAFCLLALSACERDTVNQVASADSTVAATTVPTVRFVSITAGHQFTCAVDDASQAWCWGSNRLGQLGLGDTLDRFVPTQLQHSAPFVRVVAGHSHACAIDSLAALHCWGDNRDFALGDTAARVRARPGTVNLREVRQLALGAHFTCVTDSANRPLCWGSDEHGENADGDVDPDSHAEPRTVAGKHRFTQLAAGRGHACGLTESGAAWCWGAGGALGDGGVTDRREPVEVLGGRVFTALTAGESITCAIESDGLAWCWGIAFDGQLGQGSAPGPNALVPTPVSGFIRFKALAAGYHRVCGLDLEGAAWCWGSNDQGGLGDNSSASQPSPVRVVGDGGYVAIAAGDYHTCTLDIDGAVWCWGENSDARGGGALGDGTVRSRAAPTRVAPPGAMN